MRPRHALDAIAVTHKDGMVGRSTAVRTVLIAAAATMSCLLLLSSCGAGQTTVTQTLTHSTNATPSPQSTPTATPSDPTAGWTLFSDAADSYSFQYPPNWHVFGPCRGPGEGSGYRSQVRISPKEADICGADNFSGDIIVDVQSAPESPAPTPSQCTDVSSVTVGGVQGTRWTHLSSGCGDYPLLVYQVVTGGRYYTSAFDGYGTSVDLTSQLDLIMRRTWAFHA